MSVSDPANDNKTEVLGAAALPSATSPPSALETGNYSAQQNSLQIGTLLGEFEIIGIVGEGGFGIVYLAQDHSLRRKVALKEYMPSSLASRGTDASVSVRSERYRETFEIGRRSFVNEARLLAQFDHPALVKVYRFWEENGTAYMAMPFYEGKTLRDVLLARSAPPDETWIKKILLPVIDSLELIHQENCFHRDIAPDNIMLLRGDRPVLLDFGAARRVISDMTQALTVILKPGYAPIEQYAEMPGMRQGPWTDVYALAAVVYFMITGKTPPPSVGRMVQDSYLPLTVIAAGRYGDAFLRGIDKSLGVRANERPQSMTEMRELLGMGAGQGRTSLLFAPAATKQTGSPSANMPAGTGKVPKIEEAKVITSAKRLSARSKNQRLAAIYGIGLIIAGGIATALLKPATRVSGAPDTAQSSAPPAAAAVPAAKPGVIPKAEKPKVYASPLPQSRPQAQSSVQTASPLSAEVTSQTPVSASAAASGTTGPANPRIAASSAAMRRAATDAVPAKAVRPSRPGRKEPASHATTTPKRTDSPEAEREYLRKLNKDIDGLVRP